MKMIQYEYDMTCWLAGLHFDYPRENFVAMSTQLLIRRMVHFGADLKARVNKGKRPDPGSRSDLI